MVLDQLTAFLKPHGFCFGPDVATSSRATIGGLITSNSSGARVPVYGITADHVVSLEIVFANGRIVNIGREHHSLGAERRWSGKLFSGRNVRTEWQRGVLLRGETWQPRLP